MFIRSRGCSSLGRAVGSQSAGTGIDTLLLHTFLVCRRLWLRFEPGGSVVGSRGGAYLHVQSWLAADVGKVVVGALAQW